MQDSFDVLEEKVRKAAELVRKLRKENKQLDEQLKDNKGRLAAAEKKLAELESQAGAAASGAAEVEGLNAQLATLKTERDQVLSRVTKIVSLLEALD